MRPVAGKGVPGRARRASRGKRRGATLDPGRASARLLSFVMVTCVLAPLRHNWGKRPVDGFPLSYYPMFSAKREATAKVTYLVGLDGRGDRIKIPYSCAGSGGLNQVRRQIRRAVRRGHSEELCARVAREVRRRKGFKEVVTLQVVTGTYHLDDYFSGRNRQPLKEKLHASVPVEPGRARPGTGAAPTLPSGSAP